jgi:N,N'-diacetyl-8-epilegionaminate cytidylyltransferase
VTSRHPRIACFIFARGGSKGLPGKNLLPLGGRPLIAHSIEVARKVPRVEAIIVSTDSEDIAEVARRHGAETPFRRPAELATDTAPEWQAWRHAIEWFQRERGGLDVFLSLPATSPFRSPEDVEACIDLLLEDAGTDAVVTVREADRSPFFNMVMLDGAGIASLVNRPNLVVGRRQDAPAVFDLTTVAYAVRPAFVMSRGGLFEGRLRTVLVPRERALDIDTPYDYEIATALTRWRETRMA